MLELNKIYCWDCLDVIKSIDDNSIDSIVTDPPYELWFMGKSWDSTGIANNVELWRECLRVLKPWGHLLSFSGTRTYHRMASAIEDAGFEVRDMIEWCYGSGFPKSRNIGKDVEKTNVGGLKNNAWSGWGTALKPAHEPICMARKPLAEKTVAENCLKWGTGGINIDESRVGTGAKKWSEPKGGIWSESVDNGAKLEDNPQGRFPANLIHDNSEEVRECFPETKSGKMGPQHTRHTDGSPNGIYGKFDVNHELGETYGDSGNASRFFKSILYYPKASKSERNKWTQDYLVFNITLWGENMELDELQQNDMLEKIRKWCIDWFGKKWIDQSQIDFKSTIKIETKKITILVILNFLVHLNIKEYTVDAIETKNENDENLVENVENTSPLKQIITKELTEYLHDVSNVVFKMPVKINVSGSQNNFHSTVKPIALMEYLVKMVTKEWGVVLDPFAWSWTTLVAAKKNGYNYIGIELTEEYIPIIEARLNATEEIEEICDRLWYDVKIKSNKTFDFLKDEPNLYDNL